MPDQQIPEAIAALEATWTSDFPTALAPTFTSLAQDSELLSDFVLESREHMTHVEAQLLVLETDPGNAEALKICFRAFHTIKGLAGFLGFNELQQFCHEIETLLDQARNASLCVTPEVIDMLLSAGDFVRAEIDEVAAQGSALAGGKRSLPEPLISRVRGLAGGASQGLQPAIQASGGNPDGHPAGQPALTEDWTNTKIASEKRLLKVDTAKFDHLIEVVGELVIAQSLVRNDPVVAGSDNPRLDRKVSHLGRIVDELQKSTLSIRMVPIAQLFGRMQRLVRDLSRKSGKPVALEVHGEEIELDRNIVEELADPLMHMVRNAIDHGIETPEARLAAGKKATARITLSAAHRAGHILVKISDDGRGLNREKILARAAERGIVAPGTMLSDQEVFGMIFEAGLSTAEQVTDLSGRGVGMDVVRKQIHKLRGRIETQSLKNVGTTFTLRLPLTLAIIDGLVVSVGQTKFLLPISSIREVIRPAAGMITTVENRCEIALIREKTIPVIRLSERFGIETASKNVQEALLIVVENSERSFGLLIDELLGKQEVVIKSLGHMFADHPGIAGAAILADGRVGLLLDPELLPMSMSRTV